MNQHATITIKTIDKTVRQVSGEFTTVADISLALEREHGLDHELQQLIFSGKMLKPTDPVPAIPDNGFIVLTMRKSKPKPKPEAPPADPAPAPVQAPAPEPAPEPAAQAPVPQNPIMQNPAAVQPAAGQEPAPEAVETLKGMGFNQAQAEVALRLANGNVEVAGALLMEPEMMLAAQNAAENGQAPLGGQEDAMPAGELTEEQVVQMMEQHPEALQGLIQAIAQQEPQAAQLAQQNPAGFISFLTQVLNQSGGLAGMMGGMGAPGAQGAPGAGQPAGGQPAGVQIPMTPEETEAVNGLQGMFPHIPPMAILQTFKACGSDAAMAANLLFDYDGEMNPNA